ncbi:MAG: glycosyltransferase family 2 protein [Cytophagaceae bacterium]|jgi:glycosyltransferase involved in cell wall biosynthesis
MPFFSVIIPTYNRAGFISKTIESFLAQSFTDFEIVVVNDGSTDNTEEILDSFKKPNIRCFTIENSERAAARNYGAKMARGEYLNFFDSDDTPYSNHLSSAHDFVVKNKNPVIFNVGYKIVNPDGTILLQETDFNFNFNERLIKTNFLGCNSVFVKKEIFLQNPFNESRQLASSEDWELWLRLSARYKFISSDEITFQMNNHESRSLFTIAPDKIVKRDTLLTELLLSDKPFTVEYREYIPMFKSERFTFFALVYSLTKKNRNEVIRFLWKALKTDLSVLGRRRFWACIKHFF